MDQQEEEDSSGAQNPSGAPSPIDPEWSLRELTQMIGGVQSLSALIAQHLGVLKGTLQSSHTSNPPASKRFKKSIQVPEGIVPLDAHKTFLEHLQKMIVGQKMQVCEWVVVKIRNAMERIEKCQLESIIPEKKLTVATFTHAVESCLNILTNSGHSEEGIRFGRFLALLDNAVFFMDIPSLVPIREKIEQVDNNIEANRKIGAETLHYAIMEIVQVIC